jgi:signal recognition particle subunit SEC65
VKNKVVVYLTIVAFVVSVTSCSDQENSSLDKSLPGTKEKKELHIAKAKKKKKKKKPATVNKRKAGTLTAKKQATGAETTVFPENSITINILVKKINNYAIQNGFSTEYCFLVDMSLPGGRKRFFVYDLAKGSIVYSGLVAHGSCNQTFLSRPRFSNSPGCGCSSLGKYKVGEFYRGKYGKSFRLYGLDNCNSNAYKRAVVIHGYDCVPDEEIYPRVLCNSEGCVMVSYKFFDKLSGIIKKSEKPIILWVYQ